MSTALQDLFRGPPFRCNLFFSAACNLFFSARPGVQKGSKKKKKKKKKKLSACRGEGSAAGPLLDARALPLRCCAKFYTG